jgi:hypothetical protein
MKLDKAVDYHPIHVLHALVLDATLLHELGLALTRCIEEGRGVAMGESDYESALRWAIEDLIVRLSPDQGGPRRAQPS